MEESQINENNSKKKIDKDNNVIKELNKKAKELEDELKNVQNIKKDLEEKIKSSNIIRNK